MVVLATAIRFLMLGSLINEATQMNTMKKLAIHTATIAFVFGLTACAGMSTQDKNTAVGAGAGFVSSQADINKAVEVARSVKGVKSVKNDMKIK